MDKHQHHADIAARLKRASGHLNKVVAMIEAEKGCEEVAQQLQAVCNALLTAKRAYVTDHIEHCLDVEEGMSMRDVEARMKSMKSMTKYL
ncbi:MAG: metal-sensing transcriptional repressor [Magnetococcales bacterium]|nr:metal-sensing transcriptional repressor [Magnetococcales bacterium]